MPQLKFYARPGNMVAVPGTTAYAGQVSRYLGRKTLIEGEGKDERVSYPATQDGFTVDSETDVGRRVVKLVQRDAAFWPANRETAAACGVPFQVVEFKSGEWVEKAATAEKDK